MPIESCTEKSMMIDHAQTEYASFDSHEISPSENKIKIKPTKTKSTDASMRVVNNASKEHKQILSAAISVLKKSLESIAGTAGGTTGDVLERRPMGEIIGGIADSDIEEIGGSAIGEKITEA